MLAQLFILIILNQLEKEIEMKNINLKIGEGVYSLLSYEKGMETSNYTEPMKITLPLIINHTSLKVSTNE